MPILAILLTLLLSLAAAANIIFVTPNGSGDYFTILSAYNASAAGDTILIGPGTYNESVTSINRRLHIIGAGFDVASTLKFTFNTGGSRSTVEGMRFDQSSNDAMVFSSSDSVTVRRWMPKNTSLWRPSHCSGQWPHVCRRLYLSAHLHGDQVLIWSASARAAVISAIVCSRVISR